MEEAGGSLSCPHKIEEIINVLNTEIAGSKDKRQLPSVVLLLVDIDNLERINRWYGRAAGNEVLASATKLLKRHIGAGDLLARFGGDEFLILLRGVSLAEAKKKSAGIIEAVRGHNFGPKGVTVSVSIGIAHYFSFAFSSDEMLGCAVEALALAQKEGSTFKVFMEEEAWDEE